MNALLRKVYTRGELQDRIKQRMEEYEQSKTKNDYRSMAQGCYDIGRLFELLEDKSKSEYYYQKVVWNASKLFYHPETGEYLFYYADNMGKEWVVIIKKFGATKFYELRTAYRVDCPLPKTCVRKKDGKVIDVYSYLDYLECEGFELVGT